MKRAEDIVPSLAGLRVVLVHDWLTGMRGGEKVLEALCALFPDAPLYTLLHVRGTVCSRIEGRQVCTSFVQSLPLAASRYRHYLPLFPRAAETLSLPPCDLVLSSSHCVAKGVRPPRGALHVSYVHTPMRYIWDMYDQYFGPGRGGLARYIMPLVRPYLRRWDVRTASRVDHYIANSAHVAARISKTYGRRARVIHPPVEAGRFAPAADRGDYYLVVSALAPYKRVDLAVAACTASGRRLKVVGTGPEEQALRAMAGPSVEFLGWQSDDALPGLYARARAFLFCGEEDFGITPLEAMASGTPVIAYGRGGVLETVVGPDAGQPPTGLFFGEQSAQGLLRALESFEASEGRFKPMDAVQRAAGFDTGSFMERMARYLEEVLQSPGRGGGIDREPRR